MHQSGSERATSIRPISGAVVVALCLVAIQIPSAFGATSVESVEGSAYGAYASIDLGLLEGTLGAVPSVALPPDGGDVSKTAATVNLTVGLTEIVDLDALEVTSTGSGVGSVEGKVQSVAVVNGTDILGGIIQADEVTATCSSDGAGTGGDVTLVGASVAGVGPLPVSPAPNTSISVPGVGTLVLNKQTSGGDGALTVSGLSLSLLPALGAGTVVIAGAECGVETIAAPPTTSSPVPPTTENTTTTEPGPSATANPGSTTTLPGPTTTANQEVPTTATGATSTPITASGDPTTAEVSPGEVSDSELEGSEAIGSEWGTAADEGKTEGSEWHGPQRSSTDPDRDTAVAGTRGRWGGPPAPGQVSLASESLLAEIGSSARFPTWGDLAVIGGLIASIAILIDRRKLDLRRLVGMAKVSNRWR